MTDHISSIQIREFRTCNDIELVDLGNIVVFVGRNGVGKTNLLKAIEGIARCATSTTKSDRQFRQISAEIEFQTRGKHFRYILASKIFFSRDKMKSELSIKESVALRLNGNKWSDLIVRDNDSMEVFENKKKTLIQISAEIPCLQAAYSLLPQSSRLVKYVATIVEFLDGVKYFPLDEHSKPSELADSFPIIGEKEYQAWAATLLSPSCSLESVCLQLLHLWRTDKRAFREVAHLLGDSGLGLIDEIIVQRLALDRADEESGHKEKAGFYRLAFRLSGRNGASTKQYHQFSHLSVGTRRIVRLIVAVLTGQTTVALIEHPEDAIHTGMVKKLMDILRVNSTDRQLFVASHSPQVFNVLNPDQTRLVWMESGRTNVRSLTGDELNAATNFICSEGPLSEYLESLQDN